MIFVCLLFLAYFDAKFDMKKKVEDILETVGFKEKRARTMDVDDFLK
jgi:hypothetical protein